MERRKAPEPPCPSRPPSCPPNYQVRVTRVRTQKGLFDSCEDITKIEYVRKADSISNLSSLSGRGMAKSVPDYLNKIDDDAVSLGENASLDSRLWLDGSPPAHSQIYPQNEDSPIMMNEPSWSSPTEGKISRKPSQENGEPQNTPPPCSPSPRPKPLARSKVLSQSVSCLATEPVYDTLRPVPKPRTGKAITKRMRAATETDMTAVAPMPEDFSPSLELPARPRNNSESAIHVKPRILSEGQAPESDVPIRPRNNSMPCTQQQVTKMRQKKHSGGRKRTRSRKLSPPSTPPPPPLPLMGGTKSAVLFPLLPPSPPSSPPLPRRDSGPPTFVPLPPRLANHRDSGPPSFIPTPPPVVEEEGETIFSLH